MILLLFSLHPLLFLEACSKNIELITIFSVMRKSREHFIYEASFISDLFCPL